MIGKNKLFWKYYHKIFNKEFNLKFSLDKWYKEVNLVKPSLIRIESDEVTYCLHVILRFEIELALIEGSIKVIDLPKIWNKKMQDYLEIIPKNYKEGVLQDVHWSQGAIGYFPTYVIGTIYASQLYSQLIKEKPEIKKQIENGNFSQVSLWLKNKVHNFGNTITAEEIIKKTCKEGLNPNVYIKYLNDKYSEIYDLK